MVPKIKTDVKRIIVKRIISLRKENEDGKFHLSQAMFVRMLENVWGNRAIDTSSHHNDRVCLLGIIMTLPKCRESYQKLARGEG